MCEVLIANFCEGREGIIEFGEGKKVTINNNCMEINVEDCELTTINGKAVRKDKNGVILSEIKDKETRNKVLKATQEKYRN